MCRGLRCKTCQGKNTDIQKKEKKVGKAGMNDV